MPSTNNNIVAAIVLGSSKITGMVGTKEIDGSIRVKAQVAQTSSDFISKGRVLNVEKMVSCLTGIKTQLEEQASCKIKYYYVGIGCLGLRTVYNEVEMQFPSVEPITDNLLTTIAVRNKEGKPNGRDILEAIPLEYRLGLTGTLVTLEPKGTQTDRLQAKFLNIICSSTTIATLNSCFHRAGIALAGGRFHISAQHLASVLTSEQERTTGCVLVDIGSETTTVAIYKSKLLRHLVVIPLGSNSITRDIENVFYVERDEAEHLKRTYGYPSHEETDEKTEINLRDGGRTRTLGDLTNIIDARVEEIVQNVKHQIELSQLTHETLVNGIYVTGGGAMMKNIQSAFNNHFKEWKVRITKSPAHLAVAYREPRFNEKGTFNTALGLIFNAEINCYGGEYRGIFEEDSEEIPDVLGPGEAEIDDAAAREEKAREEAKNTRNTATQQSPVVAEPEEEEEEEDPKPKKKGGKFGSFIRGIVRVAKDIVNEDSM